MLVSPSPYEAAAGKARRSAKTRRPTIQTTAITTGLRKLGYVAVLAVGLALGAAVPAMANAVSDDQAAICAALGFSAPDEAWSAPPSPGRPGEAF